jgi:hypothetical protein
MSLKGKVWRNAIALQMQTAPVDSNHRGRVIAIESESGRCVFASRGPGTYQPPSPSEARDNAEEGQDKSRRRRSGDNITI